MAGLAPISLQQRCGIDGKPFPNARAFFYEAETLTPINTYRDYSLGSPHPHPVVADAYGVFPAIYIDEAIQFYRMRITTADGTTLTDLLTLPVIGPSGGGGGSEVPVDPDALFKTGFPIWIPMTGTLSGFVRMNGRTIGSAASGSSERANADTEALYTFIYQTYPDTICPVIGGRGSSAAADFAANKPITLLDMRNKGPFGLDNMGNSTANGFSGVTFAVGNATTPGAQGGASMHTLTAAQVPVLTGTTSTDGEHTHSYYRATVRISASNTSTNVTPFNNDSPDQTPPSGSHSHTVTVNSGGGGAHNNMPPFMLGTWYIKL
jgi:microcystin-dependent protein